MGVIYTCRMCGINPFNYVTALIQHKDDAAANPANWLPWNYTERLPKPDETG